MVAFHRTSLTCAALRATQVALAVGVVVVVVRAIGREPVEVPSRPAAPAIESKAIEAAAGLQPLDWYAPIWQRDLNQEPFPQTVADQPGQPTEPPPELPRLVGTFVEPQTRWAHFVTAEGKTRVCRIDQTIDHYRVAEIEPGRAKLALGEEAHWVEVPKSESRIHAR